MPGPRPASPAQARDPGREEALAVGRGLHVARLARDVDLATAARDLLIPRDDLEALEGGEFGRVAGRVRLAVLLRAYGNHLGLDGDRLAGPWKAEVDRLALPPVPERRGPRLATALAAASLLLAGGAGYRVLHGPAPAASAPVGAGLAISDGRSAPAAPARFTAAAAVEAADLAPRPGS